MTARRQPRPDMLVGRAGEVAELERALDRLASGEPWTIQVVGEPGIGKSRLLLELARRAEARDFLVLEGRAAESERGLPFGVVIDALNDYVGALPQSVLAVLGEETVAELSALLPSLAAPASAPVAPQLGTERYRTHYAIRALLERLAAQQPTVLALDDLHWADHASIEVIGHLVRRFNGPLLGAFAFRRAPAGLAAFLDAAQRAGSGSRLELVPLSAEEAAALFDSGIDAATRAALYEESGGNPFYLEELQHAAARRHSGATPAPTDTGGPAAPPPSVVVVIREELAALPGDVREVLESAAIAGDAFEPDFVATVADTPEPLALSAIDRLLEADLIRPTDVPRRFRFRHPIVRRAVYQGMPAGSRIAAHARAAAALRSAGAPIAARAHHVELSAASGDEDAIALLVDAARAVASRAPRASGRWLTAALRLLPAEASAERRLPLLTAAAAALGEAGAFEESLGALQRALPLVPAERQEERAGLIVQIAAAKRQTGQHGESRAVLEGILAALPDADGAHADMVRLELALGCYFEGAFDSLRELATRQLGRARERGDDLLIALAAALVSVAEVSLGRADAAATALAEAQHAFDRLPDERLATRIDLCGWIGLAAVLLGRVDDTLRSARRGLVVCRASEQGATLPGLLGLEAQALMLRGQVRDAVGVAETATDAARLAGTDQLLVWALQTMSTAALWSGDLSRATASAREAASLADAMRGNFFGALSHLHLAGALQAAGDAAGAAAELARVDTDAAAPLLDLSAGRGWELLVATQLDLGNLDAAADAAAQFERRAAAAGLPQLTATARCARARVALARGDAEAAATAAAAAASAADRAGNTLLGARARAVAGAALVAQGSRARGVEELQRAHQGLVACGARREADAAARRLRRLGRRVARPGRPGPDGGLASLSAREREVAEQVAAGKTNRSIAAALFLSEKTVESHLARIYDKIAVRSRVALAALLAHEHERESAPR
jgi:DNA-binding CsgD family transcriptional regulator/tetratricopeptide (TPR) repeat protein